MKLRERERKMQTCCVSMAYEIGLGLLKDKNRRVGLGLLKEKQKSELRVSRRHIEIERERERER